MGICYALCVVDSPMAFIVHWSSSAGGQCPSGAIVSSVRSGPGYNVTVETVKPNCSGWEEIVSYNFTIVCETNCPSGYTVSGNSSAPVWVFPDVDSGVFTVTVTAENSCGEQTVLAQEEISVGEPCTGRYVCTSPPELKQQLFIAYIIMYICDSLLLPVVFYS